MRTMNGAGVVRATERVTVSCRALSAACSDLALALRGDEVSASMDETVRELETVVDRVGELAEQLERCAANLGSFAAAQR
jgi:hypothetical protein